MQKSALPARRELTCKERNASQLNNVLPEHSQRTTNASNATLLANHAKDLSLPIVRAARKDWYNLDRNVSPPVPPDTIKTRTTSANPVPKIAKNATQPTTVQSVSKEPSSKTTDARRIAPSETTQTISLLVSHVTPHASHAQAHRTLNARPVLTDSP